MKCVVTLGAGTHSTNQLLRWVEAAWHEDTWLVTGSYALDTLVERPIWFRNRKDRWVLRQEKKSCKSIRISCKLDKVKVR